jgi:hypothetical protein
MRKMEYWNDGIKGEFNYVGSATLLTGLAGFEF